MAAEGGQKGKVLVSSCLLGETVRYHGGDTRCESGVIDRWRADGGLVVACPETAAGLPVPRSPRAAAVTAHRSCKAIPRSETAQVPTSRPLSHAEIRLFSERQLAEAAALKVEAS